MEETTDIYSVPVLYAKHFKYMEEQELTNYILGSTVI